MNYEDSLRWLYSLEPKGVRLGLGRMRRLLRHAGDPHRELRVVHVAGTNGKGSVAAMLDSILRESGLRVGLYTSPHLHEFVERIRIAGSPVDRRSLARLASRARVIIDRKNDVRDATFFEVTTLLAFEAFRAARCDVAVLEVGLGGRLDATNVIARPLATVITRIAKDHEAMLGSSLTSIAREKAGIVKRGVPLVHAVDDPRARGAIERIARQKQAPITYVKRAARAVGGRLPLRGEHQKRNVACATTVIELLRARGVDVPRLAVRRGLANVRWAGRLELIRAREGRVLLDAAHNPDGCIALARYLAGEHRGERVALVFAASRDKDTRSMLRILGRACDAVVVTRAPHSRAAREDELAEIAAKALLRAVTPVRDPLMAVARARTVVGRSGLVVVAGSIFLVGPVRAALLGLREDPPIAM